MKTYGERIKEGPKALRYWYLFGLIGAGKLLGLLPGISGAGGVLIAVSVFALIEIWIWLRRNPTIKQIERRQRRAAESGADDPTQPRH